jgi:hypothetical protein
MAPSPEVPLIQDSVTDVASEILPLDPRKSWTLAAQHRPRGNRPSRSSWVDHGAPTIPSEIAPVENKSRVSYGAESTFMFSRRARAFRTYFIQQLDDYQFFTSFTNRSYATGNANLHPTLAPSNITPSPTSDLEENPEITQQLSLGSTSSYTSHQDDSGLQFPTLHKIWQQACRSAIGLWDTTKESPYNPALHPLIRTGSKYVGSMIWGNAPANQVAPSIPQAAKEPSFPTPTQISEKLACDQPTDAASHHSPELRGSCMAVVIGLVASIMWF